VINEEDLPPSPKDPRAAPPLRQPAPRSALEALQQAMARRRTEAAEPTPETATVKYEPVARPQPHAKVVLVVEDDDDTRELTVRALGGEYTVYTALHGRMALAMLRQIPRPDLIVSDIMLPGMDGLTLAKTLKADPILCSIPLVFLSGRGAVDAVEAINLGAKLYISKPFSVRDLLRKVQGIVR